MCRQLFVINKLSLGTRELGWEAWSLPKGELIEFTSKQLKDIINLGKDKVHGLKLAEDGQLVFDKEKFFTVNMMNKIHINKFVPLEQSDAMVNLFYVVIGKKEDKKDIVYEIVSSRYERLQVKEEKLLMMFDMGLISGGAKLENGKIVTADLEEPEVKPEQKKEVKKAEPEVKSEPKKEPVKAEPKKAESKK